MKYINSSNHSSLLPKIIGSYEEPILFIISYDKSIVALAAVLGS
jgi:hypothetical protein